MGKRQYLVITDPPYGQRSCLTFDTHKAAKDYVREHPMERAKLVGSNKQKEVRRHG